MAKGPQYSDASDGIRLLRVAAWFGPACYGMLSLTEYMALNKGWIPFGIFILLLILNLPITIAGVIAIHRSVGTAAVALTHVITATGDIAPAPTYPRQDVLIVRGQFAAAATAFRDHLIIEPEDHEARLRLAHLLETKLEAYDETERLYLDIRNAQPAAEPRQIMQATNGLIDLYRKTGRTNRLMVELARFVDRYGGSRLAAGAARELKELKQKELTSGSRHSPT